MLPILLKPNPLFLARDNA